MDFPIPELGEGVYEAEMIRWLVKPGDTVSHGQGLFEVMTDKATMEVPSPFAGTITTIRGEPGQKVKVGEIILQYEPAGNAAPAPAGVSHATPEPVADESRIANGAPMVAAPASIRAAPSVRHMARKLGIDLTRVQGTGPGGRILIDDIAGRMRDRTPITAPEPTAKRPTQFDLGVAGTRVKMIGLRRKIAEQMVASKRTIPHYSYVEECEVTEMVRLRTQAQGHFAQNGVKLTYLTFIIRAVVRALREVPLVNATFDEAANEVVLHDQYHIGIAVATPSGLIVPVIRNADRLESWQIAKEIERLSGDARSGRSRREDLGGGTFTVTSVGGIGGMISTPIINHPEVGILGIGKVVKRPVYDDHGQIRPADLIYLSFSFDHRIVDGAIGAVFGAAVIKHLQNPAALLLPERLA